jgi:transcriptional regulator GlxA family with amidase domain
VAALSRELGVSTRWLEKNLARACGETPAGLIRRHRLGAARDLLRRGEFTVSAVASLAGFSHSAHLIRCFREAFGETPGKWKDREANLAPLRMIPGTSPSFAIRGPAPPAAREPAPPETPE